MATSDWFLLKEDFNIALDIFTNFSKARFKKETTRDLNNLINIGFELQTLSEDNTDKSKEFFKTLRSGLAESLTEGGEITVYTVKDLRKVFRVLYNKLQEVAIKPEDFSVEIYRYSPDKEAYIDDAPKQLSFLTKLIPNSSIESKKTKMGEKFYLTVKTPVKTPVEEKNILSITEYFKKKKERKKKVKAFKSVLETAVAVKRINKFITKIGEGIISRRQFDSLVFY